MENATEAQKKSLRQIRIAIWSCLPSRAALAIFVHIGRVFRRRPTCTTRSQNVSRKAVPLSMARFGVRIARSRKPSSAPARNISLCGMRAPSGSGQTQVCIDHDIVQYPTWVFADGSRLVGVQTPANARDKNRLRAMIIITRYPIFNYHP